MDFKTAHVHTSPDKTKMQKLHLCSNGAICFDETSYRGWWGEGPWAARESSREGEGTGAGVSCSQLGTYGTHPPFSFSPSLPLHPSYYILCNSEIDSSRPALCTWL